MPRTPSRPQPSPRDSHASRPAWLALPRRLRREAILYGAALLFGSLVVPFLIWLAGNRVLGPYANAQNPHAGPFALLADFAVGLAHGSTVFWAVAVGPALLLLLLRLLVRLIRSPAGRG